MIYLDNSATTKPDDAVLESYNKVNRDFFANPSSIHKLGAEADTLQTKAREQAADLLNVSSDEIVFTSGGTEGNNIAIKGVALEHQHRGKHIITTKTEHASVYETCKSLEKLGFEVTYLPVDENGTVKIDYLKSQIRSDTILVSIMHVNNEIGTVQPIKEIGKLLQGYPKVFFHVDAVQSLGKLSLDIVDYGLDLCTFSGHKINGLKGTGLLYVRKGIKLFPLQHGGGQENNYRSGTENVSGNVAFVRALRLIFEKQKTKTGHLEQLRYRLIHDLNKQDGIYVNSTMEGAPHIINISVPGLKPEVIINALFEKGFIISSQSACSSKSLNESRVLLACGKSREVAISGLRISLSYEQTEKEIELFLKALYDTVRELKEILR